MCLGQRLGQRGPRREYRELLAAHRAARRAVKGNWIPANASLQPGDSLFSHYHQQMSEVFLGSRWTCAHTTINFPEADSCAARSKDSFQMTAAPGLPKPPSPPLMTICPGVYRLCPIPFISVEWKLSQNLAHGSSSYAFSIHVIEMNTFPHQRKALLDRSDFPTFGSQL